MEKKDVAVAGIALGTGLLIGAVVALLFAPQSGRETRHYIGKKAEEVKGKFHKES